MIKFGIYYHDTLDHVQQVNTYTSIVEALKDFKVMLTERSEYDEGLEIAFVDADDIFIGDLYYEEFKQCPAT